MSLGSTEPTYQTAQRGVPVTFNVKIPDDLRPIGIGTTAEAWLVATYHMGVYRDLKVAPGDFVRVNGGTQLSLPQPHNNSAPLNASASSWGTPHTARIKLGDIAHDGASPLAVGDNSFQFNVENAGLVNVHVEVLYTPGTAPKYTPPSAIHRVPMHTDLPRLGPPIRLQRVASVDVGQEQHITNPNRRAIPVTGLVPINIEAGNSSWANWGPQLMNVPVRSVEVWATGGTSGLAQIEVFLRRMGSDGDPGRAGDGKSIPRSTLQRHRDAICCSSTLAPSPTATTSYLCRALRHRAARATRVMETRSKNSEQASFRVPTIRSRSE